MDENSHYSFAITKPMPTGLIKFDPDISWKTFHHLLETVDLDDKIGHLYVVNIYFDYENATQKQRAYNEISPPIIEKQKIVDMRERSTSQLLEQYKENGDETPKSYSDKKSSRNLI